MRRQNALVLSGGGAFAAYEVGVLKALVGGLSPATGYRAIDPHIVTGTSAGSFNGAMWVSRWKMEPGAAVADMERVWLEEVAGRACGNGVFRWRGNPLNFLDLQCFAENPFRFFWQRVEDVAFFGRSFAERSVLFLRGTGPIEDRLLRLLNFSNLVSTHPFPALIRQVVDFRELRRSDVRFQAISTNWGTGEVVEFGNEQLDETRGPLIIMASSAIPGIFPPVDIPPHIFVDGGLLMNTPLTPAIRAGATDIHVIYLDPDIRRIPVAEHETTLDTMQRTLAILFASTFNRAIEDTRRINHAIDVYRGQRREEAFAGGSRDFGHIQEVAEDLEEGRKLRKVAIHRYHPSDLLGGPLGMLDFSAGQTAALIERGFRDAIAHDCVESGCVRPPGGPD